MSREPMIGLPQSHQAYRDVTRDALVLNHRLRTCEACKKRQSAGQFAPGHSKCNQCRGK